MMAERRIMLRLLADEQCADLLGESGYLVKLPGGVSTLVVMHAEIPLTMEQHSCLEERLQERLGGRVALLDLDLDHTRVEVWEICDEESHG
jgi:hypothetical protein